MRGSAPEPGLGGGPDDCGGPSPGGVDLDEIARAQVVAAACLYLAVDGHVAAQGGPELADELEENGYDKYLGL